MVGLGAVVGCRLAGAERIIAVDVADSRLALTPHHGATETLVGETTWSEDSRAHRGFGADYTFEATGNVNVMRQAVESARMAWPSRP